MDPTAEYLFNYLRDILYDAQNAVLDVEKLPEGFRDLGEGLVYIGRCIRETRDLAKALSRGDLQSKLPAPDNEMAAPLKTLQASLKHLTWQSQQVAKGDYKQRVEFMGDFALSFNFMVEELKRHRTELLEEIEINRSKSQALENVNDLLEAVTSQLPQRVIVIDRNTGEWLFANRSMPGMLPTRAMLDKLHAWLEERAHREGDYTLCEELEITDGHVFMNFSATSYPLQWRGSDAVAFVLSDTTREKARLKDLESAAYRDMATQVYNRHYGMKTLDEWIGERRRFILCFVDMDNLKYVNDKFGHGEGDNYITRVVSVLRDFSPDAFVCRLGGDEFMLLAQDWSLADAQSRMEQLRERLSQHGEKPGARYNYSISYGIVAVQGNESRPASELLFTADEKMYEYKRTRRAQRRD